MSDHTHSPDNDDALGTIDPDLSTTADLLGGDLTREEVDAFKDRMATDPAFLHKVGPIISAVGLMTAPNARAARESFSAEMLERYAPPPRRSWFSRLVHALRARRRVGWRGARTGTPATATSANWDRTSRRMPRILIFVGVAVVMFLLYGVYVNNYQVPIRLPAPTFYGVLVHHTDAWAKQETGIERRGLSPVNGTGQLVVDSTGPGESHYRREPGGWVYIHPDSRFSYRSSESITELIGTSGRYHGSIDGDVVIKPMANRTTIDTPKWAIELNMTGQFAVRHIPGSDTVYLTVGDGFATVRPRSGGANLTVARGQFALLPDLGPAIVTQNGAGFPEATVPKGIPENDHVRLH